MDSEHAALAPAVPVCSGPDSAEGQLEVEGVLASIHQLQPTALDAEALVREHYTAIYGYLARRVGGDIADDLAAEVFAQALRDQSKYDPALGSTRMWLFGIATHLLSRHRRSEKRRLTAYARAGASGQGASAQSLSTHSDLDEIAERLSAADNLRALAGGLRRLKASQRDALYLIAVAELPYEEAASVLGIPIGTLRSRASRARAELRAHIERNRPK